MQLATEIQWPVPVCLDEVNVRFPLSQIVWITKASSNIKFWYREMFLQNLSNINKMISTQNISDMLVWLILVWIIHRHWRSSNIQKISIDVRKFDRVKAVINSLGDVECYYTWTILRSIKETEKIWEYYRNLCFCF